MNKHTHTRWTTHTVAVHSLSSLPTSSSEGRTPWPSWYCTPYRGAHRLPGAPGAGTPCCWQRPLRPHSWHAQQGPHQWSSPDRDHLRWREHQQHWWTCSGTSGGVPQWHHRQFVRQLYWKHEYEPHVRWRGTGAGVYNTVRIPISMLHVITQYMNLSDTAHSCSSDEQTVWRFNNKRF